MAERNPIEDTSSDPVAKQADSPAEEGQAEIELPAVDSVSISPAAEPPSPLLPRQKLFRPRGLAVYA
jgi:hypothetical protein